MTREYVIKALTLFCVAEAAWQRAAILQTETADRRASRAQQSLQDHLSEEGWHWERFETAIFDSLNAVQA